MLHNCTHIVQCNAPTKCTFTFSVYLWSFWSCSENIKCQISSKLKVFQAHVQALPVFFTQKHVCYIKILFFSYSNGKLIRNTLLNQLKLRRVFSGKKEDPDVQSGAVEAEHFMGSYEISVHPEQRCQFSVTFWLDEWRGNGMFPS